MFRDESVTRPCARRRRRETEKTADGLLPICSKDRESLHRNCVSLAVVSYTPRNYVTLVVENNISYTEEGESFNENNISPAGRVDHALYTYSRGKMSERRKTVETDDYCASYNIFFYRK